MGENLNSEFLSIIREAKGKSERKEFFLGELERKLGELKKIIPVSEFHKREIEKRIGECEREIEYKKARFELEV